MKTHEGRLAGISVLALLVACACKTSYSDPPPVGNGTSGETAQVDSLFASSTDGTGATIFDFQTNDTAYLGDYGYTLWTLKATPQTPFISRTVELDKLSGNAAAGYGIVFCHHSGGSSSEETMLVAMINAQQEYIVGEATGSDFKRIVDWTTSSYLKKGNNQSNTMSLSLDAGTGKFTLSLNGNAMPSFSALESNYALSGDNGYIAVISPFEDFPATPEHITYKEL